MSVTAGAGLMTFKLKIQIVHEGGWGKEHEQATPKEFQAYIFF